MNTTLTWQESMSFEADTRGHKFVVDAMPAVGGQDKGMTPKELVLNGVCGCSGMDVISILRKMRQEPTKFWITADAEKTTTTPAYFSSISLTYHLVGEIEEDKLIKAVTLSMTKYCGVSYMISQSASINYQIELNGRVINQGQAQFEKQHHT